ncbi:unnamed protein product [Clavelina lepadiformis]|uniref:GDP-fucose protein O-fucosyltransferase 2 n=1 Tax=Clavelina lepadiformis TaxID=159417 RepID=A0ABP0GIR5_CLALP
MNWPKRPMFNGRKQKKRLKSFLRTFLTYLVCISLGYFIYKQTSAYQRKGYKSSVIILDYNERTQSSQSVEAIPEQENLITKIERDEHSQRCFKRSEVNWKTEIKSFYKSSADRLLLPLLYNGPNNQLFGLRQAVALAILLKRTLVLPSFYEHTLDESVRLRTKARAEDRLDVEKLRKLVRVIPAESAAEICQGKFHAFFLRGSMQPHFLEELLITTHVESGISGLKYRDAVDVATIKDFLLSSEESHDHLLDDKTPVIGQVFKGPSSYVNITLPKIKALYQSTGKCALYVYPFREFGIKSNRQPPENWPRTRDAILSNPWSEKLQDEDAAVLRDFVEEYTPPPKFIQEITEDFIQSVLRKPDLEYLAVHWRYDPKDFGQYLCGAHYREAFEKLCKNVNAITNSNALAKAIASKISKVNSKNGRRIVSVYIAAPPGAQEFMLKTKRHLDEIGIGLNAWSGDDLEKFIQSNYRQCDRFLNVSMNDVVSMVEMELSARSDVFTGSRQSNWSSVVKKRRIQLELKSTDLDEFIIDLAVQAMEGP